jgi:hypothetical protein
MAYLFRTAGVSAEQQARNRQDVEAIVRECLERVVDSFLPWESITKSLSAPPDESDESEDEHAKVQFDVSDSESEGRPPLHVSDETATLDIEEAPAPLDPLANLDATESLVLKL